MLFNGACSVIEARPYTVLAWASTGHDGGSRVLSEPRIRGNRAGLQEYRPSRSIGFVRFLPNSNVALERFLRVEIVAY